MTNKNCQYSQIPIPGRENTNVKLNVLIENIWNIPKYTVQNEHQVTKVKQSIISVLYNFCNTDNKGVLLTSPASPFGKGFTHYALITEPNKGVYTSFKDLSEAKQDQFWSTYKALKLGTIDEYR